MKKTTENEKAILIYSVWGSDIFENKITRRGRKRPFHHQMRLNRPHGLLQDFTKVL